MTSLAVWSRNVPKRNSRFVVPESRGLCFRDEPISEQRVWINGGRAMTSYRSTALRAAPDKVADFIVKAVTTLNANSHIDETQAAAR